MRACAAAVCASFSATAMGQAAVDAARTAAGQATIDRAVATGFQAGLERALRTPLEVIWLRTAAEAEMWKEAALVQAAQGCEKASPKQGCAVVGRTAWRYVFGGNAQFAPRPNEVARLVVSSLNLPDVPMTTGKLDLTGSGRLYLVTPETPAGERPSRVAVILAAGSTLQITDAVSPSVQIELKAPESQPMLLGNLAAADIHKMLALLIKPGIVNASEASVENGKVALRSGGEVQLAALLPSQRATDVPVLLAKTQPVQAAPAEDFTQVAAALEARGEKVNTEAILLASLASVADVAGGEALTNAKAYRIEPTIDLAQDFTKLAGIVESPGARLFAEPVIVAALAPAAPPVQVAAIAPRPEQPVSISAEIAHMRAEIEAEIARDRERLAQPRQLAKRFTLGV